jgi:hypothetical protein
MKVNCFLIISLLLILIGCNKRAPNDFSFIIEDEIDKIDSKKDILKRQYLMNDSIIEFKFNQTELNEIYTSFINYGLDTLPMEYEPKCDIRIIPTFYDRITIKYDNKVFKIVYNSDFQCKTNVDIKRLIQIKLFLNDLRRIIENKTEYKKLKVSDMIFM